MPQERQTERVNRHWIAAAIVPALLLGLAACTTEPTPAATSPAPAASETFAADPEPTPLGSRVPADCDALFASDAVSGGTAAAVTRDDVFFDATLQQAGYLVCEYDGAIGSVDATVTVLVAVDQPPTALDDEVASAAANGLPTGIVGPASWSNCGVGDDRPTCRTQLMAGRYAIEVIVNYREAVAAELLPAVTPLAVDLSELASTWPDAVEPWQPEADALTWAHDCEGAVRAQQDVVRDAAPFALDDVVTAGGGDGAWTVYRAQEATTLTYCSWYSTDGAIDLRILPGAAWLVDTGAVLPGSPTDLEGALAAGLATPNANVATLTALVDGSLVEVSVTRGSGPSAEQVARDVIAALVEAF